MEKEQASAGPLGPWRAAHGDLLDENARTALGAVEAELMKDFEVTAKGWADLARSVIARREAAIARVRALHARHSYDEHECKECEQDYPCSTIRALDGEG